MDIEQASECISELQYAIADLKSEISRLDERIDTLLKCLKCNSTFICALRPSSISIIPNVTNGLIVQKIKTLL